MRSRFRCTTCRDKGEVKIGARNKAQTDACPECADRAEREFRNHRIRATPRFIQSTRHKEASHVHP